MLKPEGIREREMPPPPSDTMTREVEEEMADLVIWHWMNKRPQPMQQIEETRDKNFSYVSICRIKEKKFIRLADEELREVVATSRDR